MTQQEPVPTTRVHVDLEKIERRLADGFYEPAATDAIRELLEEIKRTRTVKIDEGTKYANITLSPNMISADVNGTTEEVAQMAAYLIVNLAGHAEVPRSIAASVVSRLVDGWPELP